MHEENSSASSGRKKRRALQITGSWKTTCTNVSMPSCVEPLLRRKSFLLCKNKRQNYYAFMQRGETKSYWIHKSLVSLRAKNRPSSMSWRCSAIVKSERFGRWWTRMATLTPHFVTLPPPLSYQVCRPIDVDGPFLATLQNFLHPVTRRHILHYWRNPLHLTSLSLPWVLALGIKRRDSTAVPSNSTWPIGRRSVRSFNNFSNICSSIKTSPQAETWDRRLSHQV